MMQAFQANLCSRAADLVSSKCLTSVQEAEPSQQLLRNQEARLGTRAEYRCQLIPFCCPSFSSQAFSELLWFFLGYWEKSTILNIMGIS